MYDQLGPLRKASSVCCDKYCVKLTNSTLTYYNSGKVLGLGSRSFIGITYKYFGTKASKPFEKEVLRMKGNKGQASLHQTKIGNFFKRGPIEAGAAESPKKETSRKSPAPKKEVEDEERIDDVDEDGHSPKNGKAEEKRVSGIKRRSKSTSSELSEEEETSKKSKKPEAKKQRRRIVIADSSSEEEEEEKRPEKEAKRGSSGKNGVKEEKGVKEKSVSPKNDSKTKGSSSKKRKSEKISPEPESKSKSSKSKSPEEKKTKKSEDKVSSKKLEDKKSKTKDSPSSKDQEQEDKKIKTETEDSTSSKEPEKKTNAAKDSKPVVPPPKGWDPDYNPAKNKYHPIDDASWSKDQRYAE